MFIPNVIQKAPSIPSLANIMPYLMDAPLISLQTTSRHMHVLGYDILSQRDEELKNILSDHYFVLQSYRTNPCKDQNVFCIG